MTDMWICITIYTITMTDKNTTLRMMSQDVLVIPFSKEDAEILDRFCEKQVEEITQERLEALIIGFLTRENDEELMTAFEDFCKDEDYGDGLSLATIIPVLSEYIVLQSIENVESNKERALYSLLLKNALILAVKDKGFVAYPKAIADTFDVYSDYIADEKTFDKEDDGDVVTRTVLEADEDTLAEAIDEAEGEVIKSIVYDAAIYRYNTMVDEICVNPDNLVEEIYNVAKQLVDDTPWVYIDKKPAETIKTILGDVKDEEISLSDVIAKLKDKGDEGEYLPTSILLRLLISNDEDIELSSKTRFTAAELAVYLYYEFLAEALSKEINETNE